MNDLPVSDKSVKPLPSEPSFEYIPDDEARTSEELANASRAILETTLNGYGHATRSVHAKAHGLLHERINVLNNREYANPPMKCPPASRFSIMAAPA